MNKKIEMRGVASFIDRAYESCPAFQWARELLKNSIEAGASRVEFGIEWQAVEKKGVYRRVVADNGSGMNRTELERYFGTLGDGAKTVRGVHDNFGIGARISTLPWNPEGMVVISYKNGVGAMIQIIRDDDDEYNLQEFEDEEGPSYCVSPLIDDDGIDWAAIKPAWLTDHGTVIVLLGSDENPDTVKGSSPAEYGQRRALTTYLNTRFWDTHNCAVSVLEFDQSVSQQAHKRDWPITATETDKYQTRNVEGARYFVSGAENDFKTKNGKLEHKGVLSLCDDRVSVEWYLWKATTGGGASNSVHSYARGPGYIAVRYNGELFEVKTDNTVFRWFGITNADIRRNLTIILEPQHSKSQGAWGVFPEQSRGRLSFNSDTELGAGIPLHVWGAEFAEAMPHDLKEALRRANSDSKHFSLDDDHMRRRLLDAFGDRWSVPMQFAKSDGDSSGDEAEEVEHKNYPPLPPGVPPLPPRDQAPSNGRRRKSKAIRFDAAKNGSKTTKSVDNYADLPRARFANKNDFGKPYYAAMWSPNDPEGKTVIVNSESPILLELIEYHQSRYADHLAEEVSEIVKKAVSEILICKIAHSNRLRKFVTSTELDEKYRSEEALTVAVMGLLAEDALISARLENAAATRSQKRVYKLSGS